MDEFFCKTRLFWASTRVLFSLAVWYDLFLKDKGFRHTDVENAWNAFLLLYTIVLFYIAINEFREKDTNNGLLLVTGLVSMAMAVVLVGLTVGLVHGGFMLLLILLFLWLVVVGLKDILGNHFYIEE